MTTMKICLLDDQAANALVALGTSLRQLSGNGDLTVDGPWSVSLGGETIMITCHWIQDPSEARAFFADPSALNETDLILLDNNWEEQEENRNFGIELLRGLRKTMSSLPAFVALYTQYPEPAIAREAIALGARALVSKDETYHLLNIILASLEHSKLRKLETQLSEGLASKDCRLHTQSPSKVDALAKAAAFALSDEPILLIGEPGAGKEVIARAIHFFSDRRTKPFIYCNCREVPPELLLSHLFGHMKGAFTGAVTDRAGVFEQAEDGTLLLDELHALPPDCCTALNRITEYRTFSRVGANKQQEARCRLICAAQPQIRAMKRDGQFPADLYSRLAVGVIEVPSLRNTKEDIPRLARFFADEFALERQMQPLTLTANAINKLLAYNWPENIRELRSLVRRSIILAGTSTPVLDDTHLVFDQSNSQFESGDAGPPAQHISPGEAAALIQVLPRKGTQRSVLERLLMAFGNYVSIEFLGPIVGVTASADGPVPEAISIAVSRLNTAFSKSNASFSIDFQKSLGYRLFRR